MSKHIYINKKIQPYDKKIQVSSDKSLSIRTVLLASQAVGISKISNLLESEDVLNTLKTIKKLGVNFKKLRNTYYIEGLGLNNFDVKKKITINAGNSGTLARLILGLLAKIKFRVKLIGDKSLSRRDFKNTSGDKGSFQNEFKVYNRENLKCPRITCRGKIFKIVVTNRSSFFCNKCQK